MFHKCSIDVKKTHYMWQIVHSYILRRLYTHPSPWCGDHTVLWGRWVSMEHRRGPAWPHGQELVTPGREVTASFPPTLRRGWQEAATSPQPGLRWTLPRGQWLEPCLSTAGWNVESLICLSVNELLSETGRLGGQSPRTLYSTWKRIQRFPGKRVPGFLRSTVSTWIELVLGTWFWIGKS